MKILFYAKTLKKKLSTMKDGDSDLTRIFLQKKNGGLRSLNTITATNFRIFKMGRLSYCTKL